MRLRSSTSTLVLLAAVLVLSPSGAAAKSYHAARFDVSISVRPDGSLAVIEEVEFRFTGGPFTEIFREIPLRRTDGVEDVQVTPFAVADYDPARAPGHTEVEQRRENVRVLWRFPEARDTTRALRLSYRVLGAVRHEGEDAELHWAVLPRRHRYEIDRSAIEIVSRMPIAGDPVVRTFRMPEPQIDVGEQRVDLLARDVRRNGYAEVTVRFPGGSAGLPMPAWQQREARQQEIAPTFVYAALGLLALGIGLIALVWMRAPRGAGAPPPASGTTSPPDDLPVLLAGALENSGAQPRMLHALAAVLDLARRGFLEIAEAPRRSRFSSRKFTLRFTGAARPPPHEHERLLLDVLARDQQSHAAGVRFTDARRRLGKHWSEIKETVRRELLAARLVEEDRERERRRLLTISWVLFGLGQAAVIAGAVFVRTYGPAALLPGAGLALAGLIGLLLASSVSVLSDQGQRELARWKGFAQGVRDVARGRTAVNDPDPLERLLPWAVAFGVAPALFKRLSAQGTPLPGWFHPELTGSEQAQAAFAAFLSVHASTAGAAGGAGGTGGAGGGGVSGAR
jgi:hypothetical protein